MSLSNFLVGFGERREKFKIVATQNSNYLCASVHGTRVRLTRLELIAYGAKVGARARYIFPITHILTTCRCRAQYERTSFLYSMSTQKITDRSGKRPLLGLAQKMNEPKGIYLLTLDEVESDICPRWSSAVLGRKISYTKILSAFVWLGLETNATSNTVRTTNVSELILCFFVCFGFRLARSIVLFGSCTYWWAANHSVQSTSIN